MNVLESAILERTTGEEHFLYFRMTVPESSNSSPAKCEFELNLIATKRTTALKF